MLVLHLGLIGGDLGLDTFQPSVQSLELLLHDLANIFELVNYLPLPLRLRRIVVVVGRVLRSAIHGLPLIRFSH